MASLLISDVIELITVDNSQYELDTFADLCGISVDEIISSVPLENVEFHSVGYYDPKPEFIKKYHS
jgi:hypothetical protein